MRSLVRNRRISLVSVTLFAVTAAMSAARDRIQLAKVDNRKARG